MIFVDEAVIHAESGRGGRGCESHLRRPDRKMIPTGGDGGRGGSVIIRADANVTSLYPFILNKHYRAESGQPGSGNKKTGRDGKDIVVRVPCGTIVFNKDENLLVKDLAHDQEEVVALKGGRGGTGNAHVGREVSEGDPALMMEVVFSLHLTAEVCLVGSPNAGKSYLLNHLTRSKAKTQDYPFSTRQPQLGMLETEDYRSLLFCELPALIEGSNEGKGLGCRFLKHLSRAKLMVLMLNPLNYNFDLQHEYDVIRNEINIYNPELLDLPQLVVISRWDDSNVREGVADEAIKDVNLFRVSVKTGEGLDLLTDAITKVILNG